MIKKIYYSNHAIIIFKKYFLLQHRDNKKNIHFPDFWGLFGGKQQKNELSEFSIQRELNEETNLNIASIDFFLQLKVSSTIIQPIRIIRYFICYLSCKPKKIKISEGKNFNFFTFKKISSIKINPFDYSAISLFYYSKIKKIEIIPRRFF